MANAVAALSLQLIVGVVLGGPDASVAGVNTWHFFKHPHTQQEAFSPCSAVRFWLLLLSSLLRQYYHLSFTAARQTMWLWCESYIQLIIYYTSLFTCTTPTLSPPLSLIVSVWLMGSPARPPMMHQCVRTIAEKCTILSEPLKLLPSTQH